MGFNNIVWLRLNLAEAQPEKFLNNERLQQGAQEKVSFKVQRITLLGDLVPKSVHFIRKKIQFKQANYKRKLKLYEKIIAYGTRQIIPTMVIGNGHWQQL